MYELTTTTWLPFDPDRVFAFFADAGNLDRLTPPWLRFRIATPQPVRMAAGTLIDYRLRVRGIPLRWRSAITAWDPPRSFVDEQVRGPYTSWSHTHTFEPESGGTRVGDRVVFAVPGGRLIATLVVVADLRRIFAYRHRALHEAFGTIDGNRSAPVSIRRL